MKIHRDIEKNWDAEIDKHWAIWWHKEGSGMPPLKGEDTETHVKRITRIAWHNGAFKANENSQRH